MKALRPLLALVSLLVAAPAFANLQVYDSRSAFLAATGSLDATGPLPNLGFVRDTAVTVGTVTYTPVPGSTMWMGAKGSGLSDWTSLLPGSDVALNDVENLDLVVASPVYSLGFDFVEPSGFDLPTGGCFVTPCVDSTFTVTLVSGGVAVGSFTFNAPDDVAAFVGVSSAVSFDTARIRETVGSLDDEYFGRVYTGGSPVSSVPEPATGAMLLAGLAAAVGSLRRRRD
jgi:hypothetical protein